MLTRRRFTVDTLRALTSYALVDTLVGGFGCAADGGHGSAAGMGGGAGMGGSDVDALAEWLHTVNDLGAQVKAGRMPQADWQSQMEELLGMADLDALADYLGLDTLVDELELPVLGAKKQQVVLPDEAGLPTEVEFVHQVFAMRKGGAIVPHGHDNMVSTFLFMRGSFRGRHFERLEDEADALIITPSIDDTFARGAVSSLTDFKDNVHWYVAQEERSYMLNLHVRDVVSGGNPTTGRLYVDPNGEKLSDNRIRAPLISYDEAHALFGDQG